MKSVLPMVVGAVFAAALVGPASGQNDLLKPFRPGGNNPPKEDPAKPARRPKEDPAKAPKDRSKDDPAMPPKDAPATDPAEPEAVRPPIVKPVDSGAPAAPPKPVEAVEPAP